MSESLYELRRRIERGKKTKAVLDDLTNQKTELEKELVRLRAECRREEEDAARLQGHSFAALIYAVLGQKAKKIEIEKAEAYAAQAKQDAAAAQLTALENEIRTKKEELRDARRAETEYRHALENRADALREAESDTGRRFVELETALTESSAYLQEVDEALSAAVEAGSCADAVLLHLGEARMLSEIDLFSDSLLVHVTKHDELDTAERRIQNLQNALRRLNAELTDVQIRGEESVALRESLRFADWFFDGFLADWTVLDHITASQGRIREIRGKLSDLTDQLKEKRDAAQGVCTSLERERNACIWDADE